MSVLRAIASATLAVLPATMMAATPAMAQNVGADAEQHQSTVGYGDLDLTTPKGRARLDVRIQHAAAMVCGRDDDLRALGDQQAARQCYNAALTRARTQMATQMAANPVRKMVSR